LDADFPAALRRLRPVGAKLARDRLRSSRRQAGAFSSEKLQRLDDCRFAADRDQGRLYKAA
jgi:hypothetical protein